VRRPIALAVAVLLLALPLAAGAGPADGPNDPDYGPGGALPGQCSASSEQYYLWSFIPSCYPTASDPEGAAGVSADEAWRRFTQGSPDTLIAYVENGVNWRGPDVAELVDKAYLNARELPSPQRADGTECADDCNADGRFSASDFARDPRVADHNGNAIVDPSDLVVAFSDGADDDANGYTDDISGWDFMEDTNDVQIEEKDYAHANVQSRAAAAETNNGLLGAGVCPKCSILFVGAAAEDLPFPDRQAEAFLYAVDQGADVILAETVSIGYTRFQRDALEYAHDKGVVVQMDSNDFESTDHTDGMYWPRVLPAQSLVPETAGAGGNVVRSFRNRSNLTSYGTHSLFPVPTRGGSSSAADPVMSGVAALIASYGAETADDPSAPRGSPHGPLSSDEIKEILVAASSPVTDPLLSWPAPRGRTWSLMYGYGRPNLAKALALVHDGAIPPVADITEPGWYRLVDPTTDRDLVISGTISALRAGSARYVVEYALGPEPRDDAWHALPSAVDEVHGVYHGPLATLHLADIPERFWKRPFRNTGDRTPRTTDLAPEQYALSLRVRVTDDHGRTGEDRRAVYVHHERDELAGWPRLIDPGQVGGGGEPSPVLADLDGDGRSEIVHATANGEVHAYRVDGTELEGWPVHTAVSARVGRYAGAPAYTHVAVPHEPILTTAAVGDLGADGTIDVVATTTDAHVYAWDAHGRVRDGFPVAVSRNALVPYPVPSPILDGRTAKVGAFASPVLADVDGRGGIEIVQSSWDGNVYILRADGSDLPGWPVRVRAPDDLRARMAALGFPYYDEQRIVAIPAVGDITGDARPEIVVGSQEAFLNAAEDGPDDPGALHPVYAIRPDGNAAAGGPYVAGWPVLLPDSLGEHSSSLDFVGEGSTAAVIVRAPDPVHALVIVTPTLGVPAVLSADGQIVRTLDNAGGPNPDVPVALQTSGAIMRVHGEPVFVFPGPGIASTLKALLFAGTAQPIYHYLVAWDALTGATVPGFPRIQQGFGAIGGPAVADVDGDGVPEILQATDSMTLHAFSFRGGEARGYPKFTGGWAWWAPSIADADGDGTVEIAYATREGYLHLLHTRGAPSGVQWGGWQGGPAHTGVS
jgi:hypothetical protein